MTERFTGLDATMLHLESQDTPMHTLKVMVLAHHQHGLQLQQLRTFLSHQLKLVPRLTQIVAAPPVLGARPFWVPDPGFDINAHLSEVTLLQPGTRGQLDQLCARLAETHLPRNRPLWAVTLVHGLEEGRQALVLRLHHAIADGLASINLFTALTTPSPADLETVIASEAPHIPAQRGFIPSQSELTREVVKEATGLVRELPGLLRHNARVRSAVKQLSASDVPKLLRAPRTSFSAPSGAHRVCASTELAIADLRDIGRATGVTLNGVLHGVLAGAIRAELLARGEALDRPNVAIMGVAEDVSNPRCWGNELATVSVYLRSDLSDPYERLVATARSCRHAVERRRVKGFAQAMLAKNYGTRIGPRLRPLIKNLLPRVVNNVTTANVPGPQHTRWFGQQAVEQWISYAVAVAPADVNITAHSYDGTIAVAMVSTPESMPDPDAFLARLGPALAELQQAVRERQTESEQEDYADANGLPHEHSYADYTQHTTFAEAAAARIGLLAGVVPRTLLSSWQGTKRTQGLPPMGFGARQFGEGALDEFAVATVACLRRVPSPVTIARGVDDCRHIAAEIEELGTAGCHPAPQEFRQLDRSTRYFLTTRYEQIEYVSQPELPPSLMLEGFGRKEVAAARVLRGDPSKPWVVWLHGAAQGHPNDLVAFRANHWHKTLGLNVVLPVLPLHGPRKRPGITYPSFDLLLNTTMIMRAVWDVRTLLLWIQQEAGAVAGPIRVGGMSLGAPVAALVASTDPAVESVAAVVPLMNLHATMARHLERAGSPGRRLAQLMRSAPVRTVDSAIDPLLLTPYPTPERRLVIAGLNDRLTGIGAGYTLQQHWQGQVQWHDGGHIGQMWSARIKAGIDEFLTA